MPRFDLGHTQRVSVSARQPEKLIDSGLVIPLVITGKPESSLPNRNRPVVHRGDTFGRELVSGGVHKDPRHLSAKQKAANKQLQRRPPWGRLIGVCHAIMLTSNSHSCPAARQDATTWTPASPHPDLPNPCHPQAR
jgi:hypothetical protein